VHDDTSAAERSLIACVDGLHGHHELGTTNDSHAKIDRFFGVDDLAFRFRVRLQRRRTDLDAPCIERLCGRSFELDLRYVQDGARPTFSREGSRADLHPALVEDSKLRVREVALIGALDPDLHPEFLANDDG